MATAASYYVDDTGGSDSNAGTSTGAAWQTIVKVSATTFQPGDNIYFKAGGSWTGQLTLNGNGNATSPIMVDQYGTGAKPLINGGGYETAVLLQNVAYWELNNLEVINDGGKTLTTTSAWGSGVISAAQLPYNRYGIVILGTTAPIRYHIYLRNLYVHNIFPEICSYNATYSQNSKAILVTTSGGTTLATYYDDILVENCQMGYCYDTGFTTGITHSGTAKYGRPTGYDKHKNITVRGCTFSNCGGAAMIDRKSTRLNSSH